MAEQRIRGAFLMGKRVYRSTCPGCGRMVERGYGQMGEGLLYEKGCRCMVAVALGDLAAFGLVSALCLVLALG